MVYLVAGARPNFMKIAPIVRALQADGRLRYKLIHTGQHYDRDMNDVFFEEFGIPVPDVFMGLGGGSHAEQTAKILVEFEKLCIREPPDAVVVVGDVTSTVACSLAAKKLLIPVAHVEAGLRSGDMRMPEEINRVVTDAITDWLFVTEPSGVENLRREGRPEAAIHFVGNVMVDNLLLPASPAREDGLRQVRLLDVQARTPKVRCSDTASTVQRRQRRNVLGPGDRIAKDLRSRAARVSGAPSNAREFGEVRDRAWPKRRVDWTAPLYGIPEPLEGRGDRSD